MTESLPTEIDVGREVSAVTFSLDGRFLVSGDDKGVRVWRTRNGKQIASMNTSWADNVAISPDGKWIAAGTYKEGIFVWNTKAYEQVFEHKDGWCDKAIDFSPDSKRLVEGSYGKAIVWDFMSRKQVQTLQHSNGTGTVRTAKYSPQGDRIAVGNDRQKAVRVYDSANGHLLVEIKANVSVHDNKGLVWFNDHIVCVSAGTIQEYDASSSGSLIAEWPVPSNNDYSCIALSNSGTAIAFVAGCTVSFWDTATHTRFALVEHTHSIHSIAFSPDDRFLAIGSRDGKLSLQILPRNISDNAAIKLPLSRLHPTLQEPDIEISDAALESWKHDQLDNADQLLTAAITTSQNPVSHVLASRALVRARLRLWDEALEDAEEAISIEPSLIGFIAKSVAHVGKGEKDKACRSCDIAFEYHHSSHVTFLLLIKAIIVFMTGNHRDALSRVADLIATARFNDLCYKVQAYMHLLLGNSQMESNDWEGAIQSFERAQTRMRDYAGPPLPAISLIFGWKFDDLAMTVRRRLCEALYASGRTENAVKCFRQLMAEPDGCGEHLEWALDFRQRSCKRLESLGDTAVDAQQYNDAISYYSTALSLTSTSPEAILIKRCKILLKMGRWKLALDDADQLIALDSSSPCGYELKHAALHYGGDYDNAIKAFETMLSKLTESRDPDVQQQADKYISPLKTRAAIRKIVQQTLRHSPHVLINTATGRLHNRAEQVSAFESFPIFKELVSSMTTHIDHTRIRKEVRQYYRYVVLSHKWEDNEPLFQHVIHVTVYDLEASPTHHKLQTFCKIVRDSGFNWAWSDTCCIDKTDISVLQESLVTMFRWYRDSAMMVVFLRSVPPSSPPGALARSIWNTRAWTLQEYIAAKVVRFYAQDWSLYHDLDVPNHKECPEIISEMEEATRISAQQLMALRPGLGNIREKLCLASTRETTRVEDAAYSLLGIFSAIGVPLIYGEREASLGRLIANVITRSGDASSLAWVGDHSAFNSCLPARIMVFNEPATSHLPSPIPDSEMEAIVAGMHTPSFDPDAALKLYDRLNELGTPRFAESRMTLPCIAFKLPPFVAYRAGAGRVYRADTVAFGTVDIRTKQDLTRMKPLYLVHPWLDSLLAHQDTHGDAVGDDDVPFSPTSDDDEICHDDMDDDLSLLSESPSRRSVDIEIEPVDRETGARRLVARLGRPFGALILRAVATGRRRGAMDYKRVATDALVSVQFRGDVSLGDVLANVRVLEVL